MKRKSFFLSLVFAMLFFLFGGNVNVQAETTLEPYTYIIRSTKTFCRMHFRKQ